MHVWAQDAGWDHLNMRQPQALTPTPCGSLDRASHGWYLAHLRPKGSTRQKCCCHFIITQAVSGVCSTQRRDGSRRVAMSVWQRLFTHLRSNTCILLALRHSCAIVNLQAAARSTGVKLARPQSLQLKTRPAQARKSSPSRGC